jgi:hypothetical protein
MTNETKQTAVEFIIDLIQKRIDRNFERCVQGLPDDHCRGYLYKLLEECNEAKEMEKQRMIDFANNCIKQIEVSDTCELLMVESPKDLYEQTYGDDKQ